MSNHSFDRASRILAEKMRRVRHMSGHSGFSQEEGLSRRARTELGLMLRKIRYRNWQFTPIDDSSFDAFRSSPADPKTLERLGPWSLPEGFEEGEVHALALKAVVEADGESAREEFRIEP